MIDLELVQVREEYQHRSTYSVFMNDYLIVRDRCLQNRPITSKKPFSLPHTKVCGLFVGFLGCSEKSEVAKQLLHPKGCSLISLTLENLDVVMPDIIKGLKLAHRVRNPSLN